jgi:hypothetical protein
VSIPFSGQYLSALKLDNGQESYLTINVDPDKKGLGVAYLKSTSNGTFAIFECNAHVDEDGSIRGKARRSEQLKARHGQTNPLSESDKSEVEFIVHREEGSHRLVFKNNDSPKEVFLENIGLPKRAEATHFKTWREFKDWANSVKTKDRNSIFRGVPRSSFGLKTSFHRMGRVDLERYRDSDMPVFSDLAETVGGIRIEGDIGAMWGFAQHHGFPTPLLDWTDSPYIAAYFAFLNRLEESNISNDENVRIYYLDGNFAAANTPPSVSMSDTFPRVWIFRPNTKGNQRLVFQQGLFLHSNLVEIEAYLLYWSKLRGIPVVSAVEMPASLAREAIDELRYMGVNHLTMFPGLDGAAKYAAIKLFYRPD